jgi:hypothetical protein
MKSRKSQAGFQSIDEREILKAAVDSGSSTDQMGDINKESALALAEALTLRFLQGDHEIHPYGGQISGHHQDRAH